MKLDEFLSITKSDISILVTDNHIDWFWANNPSEKEKIQPLLTRQVKSIRIKTTSALSKSVRVVVDNEDKTSIKISKFFKKIFNAKQRRE